MSSRATKQPAIPAVGTTEGELQRLLTAIKEAVEIAQGTRGDPLDRFVTLRELQSAGLAGVAVTRGGTAILTGTPGTDADPDDDVPGTVNGLPDNGEPDYGQDDFTVPPVPTNVTVRSIAPNKLMVSWDPPNYGNHAYTEVYGLPQSEGTTFSAMMAYAPAFNNARPCTGASGANPHPKYRGVAVGSFFVHEVPVGTDGSTDLGAALNPQLWSFFVRHVSRAPVCGPFAPQGTGAQGRLSIDPVRVLDAMTASVTASTVYGNLRAFIGTDAAGLTALRANGGVTAVYNAATRANNTISRLWTVRMEQDTQQGIRYAAGFGLGIDVNDSDGTGQSVFAINANKFAMMGNGTPWYPVADFERLPGGRGRVRLTDLASDKLTTDYHIVFSSQVAELDGVEAKIISRAPFGAGLVELEVERIPKKSTDPIPAFPIEFLPVSTVYVAGATVIPFIIDTENQVVGIRGKLVVDGLIRATEAEFDELRATNAFFDVVRAKTMDADVVVGRNLIAGAGLPVGEDGRPITDVSQINGYIVQLSRPEPGGYPFRIWNPSSGEELLSVYGGNPGSANPDLNRARMYLRGNLEVGGNGIFNTVGAGAAAFGARSADGRRYAFWVGPDTAYGTASTTMESEGYLFVHGTGVGINAPLFLGDLPFAQPSLVAENTEGAGFSTPSQGIRANSLVTRVLSTGSIEVRAPRSDPGGESRILVMCAANLARINNSSDGQGNKRFSLRLSLVGATTKLVQTFELDDYFPESYAATIMGVVSLPAGAYKACLEVTNHVRGPMSILAGWTCFAQYVRGNEDLEPLELAGGGA